MKQHRRFSRRKFLAGLCIAGVGGITYSRFLEPRWLGVGRATVKLRQGAVSAPIKILQLSDLHASPVVSLKFIAQAVAKGLALKPDLIFLTGDFISGKFGEFDAYAEVLSPLAKIAPCFAILGNHDGGSWAAARGGYVNTERVRKLLSDSGAKLLHNESTEVQVAGTALRLVGLGDWWAKECDPRTGFASMSESQEIPTLLLTHNPDTKELVRQYSWDVAFCGHTHGGQLQVPLIGAPFAPVRDKRFVKGLHSWEGRWIYITKGVGNLLGLRINCRPEVSLVTLS
jgi:predicted MPP superfamily phosphohydrolase